MPIDGENRKLMPVHSAGPEPMWFPGVADPRVQETMMGKGGGFRPSLQVVPYSVTSTGATQRDTAVPRAPPPLPEFRSSGVESFGVATGLEGSVTQSLSQFVARAGA